MGFSRSTPACSKAARMASGSRKVPSSCQHRVEWQIARSGDMAGGYAGAEIGFVTAKTRSVAGIDDLFGAAVQIGEHVRLAAHLACASRRGEIALRNRCLAAFNRSAFRHPFVQAAIEHGEIAHPEQPENEPRPRRCAHRAVVIQHDPLAPEARRANASRASNCARVGSAAGTSLSGSIRVFRSRNRAPGICAATNSSRASRPAVGRWAVASSTTRSGAPSSPASQSVVTSVSMAQGLARARWRR